MSDSIKSVYFYERIQITGICMYLCVQLWIQVPRMRRICVFVYVGLLMLLLLLRFTIGFSLSLITNQMFFVAFRA